MVFRRTPVIVAFLLLALAPVPAFPQPAGTPPAAEALDAVRGRVAPDRRLTLFDVSVEAVDGRLVVRGEVESAAAREAALEAVRAAAGGAPVADEVRVLPDPALGPQVHGVVRVSVANVRGKPAMAAEMVTQALMGWPVRVLKKESGWYLVHTEPDGYLGWIENLQLTLLTAAERDAWLVANRLTVTSTFAIARDAAAADAEPVTDLAAGNIVRRTGQSGEWISVALPDGRTAYVLSTDVQEHEAWSRARQPVPGEVARTARRFMGVPYLWGGTSAKGFDCSGFAKTVMYLHGIDLPRDTDQQAQVGSAVALDERLSALRTGDLLFFGTAAGAGKPERVTHVGILVGELDFVHASGLVRRNSLDPQSPIYDEGLRKRLLRVRRVLPERPGTD